MREGSQVRVYLCSFRISATSSAARSSARSSARTTQHQMQRGLLLDVVVAQCAAVLQLLAREDQALLVRGDALLVLDLLLHVLRNERNQRQNFQTKRYAQRRKATAATPPTQQSQSTK